MAAKAPLMWWWHPFQHWLAVHTGSVNEPGVAPGNAFWGGAGSDLGEITLLGGMIALYRKHACHTGWCLRFGHHDFTDAATGVSYRLCRKHHPAHPGSRQLTRLHIARVHAENRERLARPAERKRTR